MARILLQWLRVQNACGSTSTSGAAAADSCSAEDAFSVRSTPQTHPIARLAAVTYFHEVIHEKGSL